MTEQELQELINYGQGDSEPEKALQWLNDTIQAQVEYESEHKDSGDNYAQLVAESWQYHNIDDSIWQYCLSKPEVFGAMDGLVDWDIGERVEGAFFMRPYWHEYFAFEPGDGLCLLQIPISEVEIQITQYEAESKGHNWETIKRVAPYAESYLGNTYEDSLLFYATPGTSWCAVIDDKTLADILDNMREEQSS